MTIANCRLTNFECEIHVTLHETVFMEVCLENKPVNQFLADLSHLDPECAANLV